MLVPSCTACAGPVLRVKGRRGPLPKQCEPCRAKPAPPKPRSRTQGRRRGTVEQALLVELRTMPERVQASTEAAAALALAVQVDQGLSMTAATRELTRVMALLRAMTTAERPPAPAAGRAGEGEQEVPRGVTRLAVRAAARRAAAAG